MTQVRPTILKIGGSAITDKNGELAARTEIINRIAEEIKRADIDKLIVVHGGGSFGHPTAQRHGIKGGLKDPAQKVGFAETHHVMTVLNGLVMDSLVWHNIPALSITPSSSIITENGRIKFFDDTVLGKCLESDFLPVLYGDVVFDEKMGFTVLSGDQLVAYIAIKLKAKRIVIGVDTDGLFESDPKENSDAKRLPKLTLEELKKLQNNLVKPTENDVTGGIVGKISEIIPALEQGIPVKIVNATRGSRIYRALAELQIEGTLIEKA